VPGLRAPTVPVDNKSVLLKSSETNQISSVLMNSEQLFLKIKKILVDQFEVEESKVSLEANLYEELEIDSIDAVDLLVQIKELTGKKIPPEQFRLVRTIGDVLDTLKNL
jgi:acyl carrier protein